MSPRDHRVEIVTSAWATRLLDELAKSGRYGPSRGDVAEELLRAKLREVERDECVYRGTNEERSPAGFSRSEPHALWARTGGGAPAQGGGR